jgi:hypothetical protein
MSLISIGMNLLLAGLLVAAMVVGLRLNKRLKALKDSHVGFEVAVRELNVAAQRAEQGLADLRAATDEATDMLSDRIEKGRALAAKLERLVAAAPELPRAAAPERTQNRAMPPVTPPARPSSADDRLQQLLAMARSRLQAQEEAPSPPAPRAPRAVADEPLVGRAPLPGRRLVSGLDDDLFEDAPLTLTRQAGAGR